MDAWREHISLYEAMKAAEERSETEWRNHEHPNIADLRVRAVAWDRHVLIEVATDRGDTSVYADFRSPTWFSRHTTVHSARRYAKAILDACDFVDEQNPTWAALGHGSAI